MFDPIIIISGFLVLLGVAARIKLLLNRKRRVLMFEKKQPTNNASIFGPYKAGGKGATRS